MPRKTFLNLTEGQQHKVIDAALQEFSEHDFNSASLNNIISTLDVTKGSFYRYFESKKELYDFLIVHASDKKLAFIKESIGAQCKDFFEQIRQLMYSFLIFDLSYPAYGKFLIHVAYGSTLSCNRVTYPKMEDFLKDTIDDALTTGALNHEFDRDFIYHCLVKVTEGIENYISQLAGIGREKLISTRSPADIGSDKELEKIFSKAVEFLKHGLMPG